MKVERGGVQKGDRVLVTGGVRSGKSRFAVDLCEKSGRKPTLIATAQPLDEEMHRRIALHRQSRGPAWTTVEEPLRVAARLRERRRADGVVLVDCITLWLSNILTGGELPTSPEDAIDELASAVEETDFPLVLVTNEVGWGIIPDRSLARRYGDLLGKTNQLLAARCDRVILMVAGIALSLKGESP